ncbi:DUF11 domain-containing protein [Myroides odoratimimus]|uniref:DUF11 domain-containing protein n=1 Tax=Myroides odoratimimus TaxID=76832 RepID=UPI0009158F57|nr:DUF11 domain-containing protein [Myroides odoratimimus]SHL84998.1 conserved repeat domain-containing protein [Myroides odoratimimus subsp. xuanwuensis]
MSKKRSNLLWLLFVCVVGVLASPIYGQFRIEEGFYNSTVSSEVVLLPGEHSGLGLQDRQRLMLSSGLSTVQKGDPEGNGWLRLTSDGSVAGGDRGAAFIDVAFSSVDGVLLDFEYKTWRTKAGDIHVPSGYSPRGGDGFSVFLLDGNTHRSQFRVGAYGKDLGYANSQLGAAEGGVTNGYLGLGMDEYGNYLAESGQDGLMYSQSVNSDYEYEVKRYSYSNNVTLRGKVNTNAKIVGYKVLGPNSSTPIGYPTYNITTRPDDNSFYRRVQMELYKDPNGPGYKVDVRWMTSKGGSFVLLFSEVYNEVPPSTLKVGLAASTGDGVNYHEIRNFRIVPPGGVIVDKTVNKSIAKVGDDLEYTIKVSNLSAGSFSNLLLNDDLEAIAAYLKVESISFEGFGKGYSNLTNGVKTISNVRIDNLQPHSTVIFTVKGKVLKVPPQGELINKAVLNIDNLPISNKEKEKLKLEDTAKTTIESSGIIISNRNIYNKKK